MAQYSDDQLAAAGRQLAEFIKQTNARVEALEAKPVQDAFQQQWVEGQEYAKYKGYGAEDMARLEQMMVARGISRHADAIAIDPIRPSGSAALLGGLEKSELDTLMSDPDRFADNMISKVIASR